MATRAILVVALLAAPAAAQPSMTPVSWEEAQSPPPVWRRFHVAAGVGLRFTNLDIHDGASQTQLLDYGWADAGSPTMAAFHGEAEYLLAPIIDVGVAVSSARGDHAAGAGDWMSDRVRTTNTSVAFVAKVHWALQRPFIPEPRVDAGFVRRTVEVHGVDDSASLPYLRAGMDWRLGTRRAGVQVSAGYILTARASSSSGRLDPAVGGLDVSLAPYVRF